MGTTAGAAGPAEAGAAATRVREDGERRALATRRLSRLRLMDAMAASACHPAAQPRPWPVGASENGRNDCEHAPPGGSAGAGAAAAANRRNDGERAPPGGSAGARAATMDVRDDGERSAMSRELVAKKAERIRNSFRAWPRAGSP